MEMLNSLNIESVTWATYCMTIYLCIHPSPPANGAFYQAGQPQMQFCLPHMNGTKFLTAALRFVPSSLTFRRHSTVCPIAPLLQNWANYWTSTSVTFYSSGLFTTSHIEVSVLELKVLPPHPYQFSLVSLKALCLASYTVYNLYWWPYRCPVQPQHASVCRRSSPV